MKSGIQIAQTTAIRPIIEIAKKLNVSPDDLELYGKYKAKLPLSLIDEEKVKKAKLILVSAISPTPAGEGKTTTSIGLAMAMNKIGRQATVVLREPSIGPIFGIKGGATGGGYAQVIPMEDINLHFTGDFSAVEKAHNLLAALIDNNLQSKTHKLNLDPRTITWRRVMDMNDRSLRSLIVGLGGTTGGVPRESGFDITASSEVMAILCLANSITDLKEKLGNIIIGFPYANKPVFARDLNAQGAMAALLKDAIKPNLVQTLDGTPAIIHGGPFANIAQGTNSVVATKMGMSLSSYVVTEAGFGFDLGGEKFLDIKCRYAGLSPDVVVLVATTRALKYHGGVPLKEVEASNIGALRKGLQNLEKHIENVKLFNITPIVAINRFANDTPEDIAAVVECCQQLGVMAYESNVWAEGANGALELAQAVAQIADTNQNKFLPLYDWELSIEKKISAIASKIYGAVGVEYQPKALATLKKIALLGLEGLPVCMAKTQKSLSDNPNLLGRPTNFTITVRDIEIAAGAGFIVPITGDIMRMPGLPEEPSSGNIDIDDKGNITGLI